MNEQQLFGICEYTKTKLNHFFSLHLDLRQAFSAVDRDNDGVVQTKDISAVFAHLDESYKTFLVEEEDLKRLIEKIDIDS